MKIWDLMNGKYEKLITQSQAETISKILANITELDQKTLKELDILRNHLFLESILQDNNCLKQIAYDIDEVIHQKNLGILQDVSKHLGELQAGSLVCRQNIIFDKHTALDKLKWFNLFRKQGFQTPSRAN